MQSRKMGGKHKRGWETGKTGKGTGIGKMKIIEKTFLALVPSRLVEVVRLRPVVALGQRILTAGQGPGLHLQLPWRHGTYHEHSVIGFLLGLE